MKKLVSLIAIAVFVLCASNVSAQGKIGFVSADEVFAAMPDVLRADSSLAAYQQALAENYQDQQNEFNESYAKFVKDSITMNSATKEARRRILQEKITDLQNKEQQLNKQLEVEKERQLKPIRAKMLAAIQAVAKEKGYSSIFYKEQAIVFPDADDITELVKKKLGIK